MKLERSIEDDVLNISIQFIIMIDAIVVQAASCGQFTIENTN